MRLFASALAAVTALALTAATDSRAATGSESATRPDTATTRLPDHYVIPGDKAFPTGVAYDPRSGHYYVGSAQDGTLYRGHVRKPTARVWSPDGRDGRSFTAGMTIDGEGRLYVNGGATGTLRVYDTATGDLLTTLHGAEGGFVNDVTVAADGTAYVTDSFKPVVYRLTEDERGRWKLEHWLDVDDSGVDWVDGQHNLNGIVAVGDRHLLAVQSNTGKLWRVDRSTGRTAEVDLGGDTVVNGDALAWRDGRLYVTQGNLYADPGTEPQVAVIEMNDDLTHGRFVDRLVPPEGLLHPSAAALTDHDRLLVVNSQYNRWVAGLPPESLPFTVSSLPLGQRTTAPRTHSPGSGPAATAGTR
ncbi:SMP-30/gluconolactonase/LRE family protein [Streptomyces sp. NPDC017890]|uniref:SMP-30/gluconolactonase/LRE family protein n=1 Tax=Streptomyces sp. NPDC017890 TaxID=3365015 RepID=UPI0037B08B39